MGCLNGYRVRKVEENWDILYFFVHEVDIISNLQKKTRFRGKLVKVTPKNPALLGILECQNGHMGRQIGSGYFSKFPTSIPLWQQNSASFEDIFDSLDGHRRMINLSFQWQAQNRDTFSGVIVF